MQMWRWRSDVTGAKRILPPPLRLYSFRKCRLFSRQKHARIVLYCAPWRYIQSDDSNRCLSSPFPFTTCVTLWEGKVNTRKHKQKASAKECLISIPPCTFFFFFFKSSFVYYYLRSYKSTSSVFSPVTMRKAIGYSSALSLVGKCIVMYQALTASLSAPSKTDSRALLRLRLSSLHFYYTTHTHLRAPAVRWLTWVHLKKKDYCIQLVYLLSSAAVQVKTWTFVFSESLRQDLSCVKRPSVGI